MASDDKTDVVVVVGGFANQREVRNNKPLLNLAPMKATHEEADKLVVLHVRHSNADTCYFRK